MAWVVCQWLGGVRALHAGRMVERQACRRKGPNAGHQGIALKWSGIGLSDVTQATRVCHQGAQRPAGNAVNCQFVISGAGGVIRLKGKLRSYVMLWAHNLLNWMNIGMGTA